MKKILAVIAIIITGCTTTPQHDSSPIITQKHKLQPFNSIILAGNINAEIINGRYALHMTGPSNTLSACQYKIQDKILYVETSNDATIKSKIFTPQLKNITVTKNAVVTAKYFKTKKLTIAAKDHGSINLEGWYAVDKIYQFSNGRINIRWLDVAKLFIESNSNGPIYLAGITKDFTAVLSDDSQLDARYLRTQKASVFTTDNARADVLAVNSLNAFAVDKSNIYYYKRPLHLTVVTKNSGNVLHPNWIH